MAILALCLLRAGQLVVAAAPLGLPGLVGGDFTAYLTAGKIVDQGSVRQLYDLTLQRQNEAALEARAGVPAAQRFMLAFDNPPPAALLFAPLALLAPAAALAVWTLINLACTAWSALLLARGVSISRLEAITLALGMLVFWPALLGFFYGQMMGMVLLLFTLAVLSLRNGRDASSGVALATLAAIKPQYALILAIIAALQWRRRALVSGLFTGVAFGGFSLALVGWSGLLAYRREIALLDPYAGNSAYLIDPQAMINWRAVLLHVAPNLTQNAGFLLTSALSAVTIVIALAVWRRASRTGVDPFGWPLLVVTAATLLATYHSHIHGAALLIVPYMLLSGTRTGAFGVLVFLTFWPPVVALAMLGPLALALRPAVSMYYIACLLLMMMVGIWQTWARKGKTADTQRPSAAPTSPIGVQIAGKL